MYKSTDKDHGLAGRRTARVRGGARHDVESSMDLPFSGAGNSASRRWFSDVAERRATKRALMNILLDFVESGRGGNHALIGPEFEEVQGKLSVFMTKIIYSQKGTEYSRYRDILKEAKGFKSKPKNVINIDNKNESMYQLLTRHTVRTQDDENFCLQSLVADMSTWLEHTLNEQSSSFSTEQIAAFRSRLKAAYEGDALGAAEYQSNPYSRQPSNREEALDYIYFAAKDYDDAHASDWESLFRDLMADTFEYPEIKNISYQRARRVYEQRAAAGRYNVCA